VTLLTAGCVSVQNPRNYEPQDTSTSGAYYDCLRQAQQPYGTASVGGGAGAVYGSARSSVDTNDDLLCACMAAKGYRPRKATTAETVVGVTFSPIWVPFLFLAKMGEGLSGRPPHHYIGCP